LYAQHFDPEAGVARGTVADLIARTCAQQGVTRAFGVPGGGSSLDLIDAFERHGIVFHLCRTETGATLMAAADAEIRHSFGVAITTQGPGAASAMNGLAYSALDRAPVLFITDGWSAARAAYDTHQVFDQRQMSSAVVKQHTRLESPAPERELGAVMRAMRSAPWGPAHIELTSENARRQLDDAVVEAQSIVRMPVTGHGDAVALLRAARRPVMLVGLEARDDGVPPRIQQMAQQLCCPVLTTYKAKGIVPDTHPQVVGHVTGGAAEQPCIQAADLIILCGFDPVELIGRPWPYAASVLDIGLAPHPVHYVVPKAALHGPLADCLDQLLPACQPSEWPQEQIQALRAGMAACLRYERGTGLDGGGVPGLSPQDVVQTALRIADPARTAVTVDAGAHMFSVMAFWQAHTPGSVLISNGLSTMGLALPAAIAQALHAPERRSLAFTGDGGLMMCAGELATAVQWNANLCVIVFNDAALSLIALKQRDRGMTDCGVTWPQTDFATMAHGFGMRAFTARTDVEYEQALLQALAAPGPCLIDVHVDPSGYREQAKRLRG